MLIETSAGIGARVVQFAVAAREVLIIATPEPTSITDASAIIKVIWQQAGLHNFKLVVNQARSCDAADSAPLQLRSVARRFLKLDIEDIGFLPADENVSCYVRSQEPLVLAHPAPPPPAPSTNAVPPSKKPTKPRIRSSTAKTNSALPAAPVARPTVMPAPLKNRGPPPPPPPQSTALAKTSICAVSI